MRLTNATRALPRTFSSMLAPGGDIARESLGVTLGRPTASNARTPSGTVAAETTTGADPPGCQRRPASSDAPGDAGPGPRRAARVPALPDGIAACLFDLDGVLTQTAKVHAAAWKEMFDAFLRERSEQTGEPFRPFEIATDYAAYVDGKLRQDGVRAFLASRGIELPEGRADDPPTASTVHGLGTRKNDLVLELIRRRRGGGLRRLGAVRRGGARSRAAAGGRLGEQELPGGAGRRRHRAPVRGARRRRRRRRGAACAGSPRPTCSWPRRPRWASRPRAVPCSRTPSPGSRRAAPVGSAGSSASTASGRPTPLRSHGADMVVNDLGELLEER